MVKCTYSGCQKQFDTRVEMQQHKHDDPDHNYCKKCDVDCDDYDELVQHKVEAMFPWLYDTHRHLRTKAPKHICCEFCGMDFKSFGGRRVHREELHRAAQQIACPGCTYIFTSASTVVAHLEKDKCFGISARDFTHALQWKHMVEQIMADPGAIAQNLDFYAASGDDVPLTTKTVATHSIGLLDSALGTSSVKIDPLEPLADIGQLRISTPREAPKEWPSLERCPAMSTKKAARKVQQAVIDGLRKNLINRRFWDPDSADYDRSIFYHFGVERYCCPLKNCCSSFSRAMEIDEHFKESHMTVKHQCRNPWCYKIFQTTAGLVGHMEKSEKCRIRQTDAYNHAS